MFLYCYDKEVFSANGKDYIKLFYSREVTPEMIEHDIKAIAHDAWKKTTDYTVIYMTRNGDWYGWGVRTAKAITPAFRFWQDAMADMRKLDNKIVELEKQSA